MYFVTVCTANRALLLGEVAGGEMHMNGAGRMVEAVWLELPGHYAGLELDAFIVMPNHIHGILVLLGLDRTQAAEPSLVGAGPVTPFGTQTPPLKPAPTRRHALPEIVRGLKTFSARRVNESRATSRPLWQRGYYEHIIRSGKSLDRIRRYIAENPARWAFDRENPQATDPEPELAWLDDE